MKLAGALDRGNRPISSAVIHGPISKWLRPPSYSIYKRIYKGYQSIIGLFERCWGRRVQGVFLSLFPQQ